MSLRQEFIHSASPEAIIAELAKARIVAQKANRRVRDLEKLLIRRDQERIRGQWPYCGHEAQGFLFHGQRCVLAPHQTGDHQGADGVLWENREEAK